MTPRFIGNVSTKFYTDRLPLAGTASIIARISGKCRIAFSVVCRGYYSILADEYYIRYYSIRRKNQIFYY